MTGRWHRVGGQCGLLFVLALSVMVALAPGCAVAVSHGAPLPAAAGHLLLISVDGLRPDALLQADTPNIDALWQNGAYSWQAQTVLPSETLPSHASMISGLTVERHGFTSNSFKGSFQVATIFSEVKAAALSNAMIVGKEKLERLVVPGTVDLFQELQQGGNIGDDIQVANVAAQHLTSVKPKLLFVHLGETDFVGHQSGWMSSQQLATIAGVDQAVGILTSALEAAGLLENTLILLTADHGGHDFTHGTSDPLDTTIPWIASGSGINKGLELQTSIQTYDTAATVLKALGVLVPSGWDGSPVQEAFLPNVFATPTPTPVPGATPWALVATTALLSTALMLKIFLKPRTNAAEGVDRSRRLP